MNDRPPGPHQLHHDQCDEKSEAFSDPIPSFWLLINNDRNDYVMDCGVPTPDIEKAAKNQNHELVEWWAYKILGDWTAVWSLVEVFRFDGHHWCETLAVPSGSPDTATIVVGAKLLVVRKLD